MIRRATLVALTTAALLPLAAGTAHASCLDDLNADADGDYTPTPKSPHWNSLSYAQVSGTATISVQGDALVSDVLIFTTDQVRRAGDIGDNAPGAASAFVDCVAG